jgi:TatA/E family protein of Tat protein translocase
MFDIGLQEMILIGILALLVFGPSKLPELGRMVGRALREFRRASDEFRSTVETNLNLNESDSVYAPASRTPYEPAAPAPASSATVESDADPAAEPEGDTAVAADAEGAGSLDCAEPFCAQQGSRLFHRRECAWVARIGPGDRVPLKSVADARAQGFSTCPVCEPWEPG